MSIDNDNVQKQTAIFIKDQFGKTETVVLPHNVVIGTRSTKSSLTVAGAVNLPVKIVTFDSAKTTAIFADKKDFTLVCHPNPSTSFTVTLPEKVNYGQVFVIKNDSMNSCTVNVSNGITIDGAVSSVLLSSGSAIYQYSNGRYETIAAYKEAVSSGAPYNAPYVVMSLDGTLTDERVLTAGTGIHVTDGGAGGNATLAINNNVVATISGSTFTGAVNFNQGLSGSLTQLVNGTSYLVAGSNTTIVSASNGQVTISSTGGAGGGVDRMTFHFQAGVENTNTTSADKLSIGTIRYDPAIVTGSGTPLAWHFRAAIETTNAGYSANVDMYEITSVLYGSPQQVVGSALTTTNISNTLVQANLSSELSGAASPITLESRIWMGADSTSQWITCKGAWLDIDY